MITRKENRPKYKKANLRGGSGDLGFLDITTRETLPKKLRLCSEITLKSGESIGEHLHEGEAEIYYCLSGVGTVLDMGKEVKIYPGDSAVTNLDDPHYIKNEGSEDLKILATIVLD
jgi:mannose-6-phosphate isomerase-like protein (cupin superfamily)